MAQTLREANDIEAARLASGKIVFVGYMRRYATAFLRFKEAVGRLDPAQVNYGKVSSLVWPLADCSSPVPQLHIEGERC